MMTSESVESELSAALAGAACLGVWTHALGTDRIALPKRVAGLLGLPSSDRPLDVPLGTFLDRVERSDRIRIESVLHAAVAYRDPFEIEFRTCRPAQARRWLRLMGRCDRDRDGGLVTRGLAFDLTEGRLVGAPVADRAQRQVNLLADHVVAMSGLLEDLRNPPLSHLLKQIATEVGFELARRLSEASTSRRPQS